MPLQVFSAVTVPPEQVGLAQSVAEAQSWQAPVWHVPSVPQLDIMLTEHTPWGSAMPLTDWLHVPVPPPPACWSDAAQATHAPVQAVLQQNPSAQKPLWHWSAAVHGLATGSLLTHMPLLQ